MIYILYKITNNINGKIYIGAHKTDNLDDGYMGSGKLIKLAIKKYGIDNFTKEVLYSFHTSEDVYEMESVLVNEQFVKRRDTYNIKEGGRGGYDYINATGKNLYGTNGHIGFGGDNLIGGDKVIEILKSKGVYDDYCKRMSEARKGNKNWLGKTHTDETKQKIGKANSKHQSGKGNSQYGKCWIYHPDLKENKSIPRYDIDKWLAGGWIKGRKLK